MQNDDRFKLSCVYHFPPFSPTDKLLDVKLASYIKYSKAKFEIEAREFLCPGSTVPIGVWYRIYRHLSAADIYNVSLSSSSLKLLCDWCCHESLVIFCKTLLKKNCLFLNLRNKMQCEHCQTPLQTKQVLKDGPTKGKWFYTPQCACPQTKKWHGWVKEQAPVVVPVKRTREESDNTEYSKLKKVVARIEAATNKLEELLEKSSSVYKHQTQEDSD